MFYKNGVQLKGLFFRGNREGPFDRLENGTTTKVCYYKDKLTSKKPCLDLSFSHAVLFDQTFEYDSDGNHKREITQQTVPEQVVFGAYNDALSRLGGGGTTITVTIPNPPETIDQMNFKKLQADMHDMESALKTQFKDYAVDKGWYEDEAPQSSGWMGAIRNTVQTIVDYFSSSDESDSDLDDVDDIPTVQSLKKGLRVQTQQRHRIFRAPLRVRILIRTLMTIWMTKNLVKNVGQNEYGGTTTMTTAMTTTVAMKLKQGRYFNRQTLI